MSIESLKSLLEDFDPAAFLPDLTSLFGKIELILRFLVVTGPVVMLVMGLVYFFLSPKEANHTFGYRTWFGMGSVEAWNFTQKLAGLVWGGLGLILTVIMLLIVNRYRLMDMESMLWSAVRCLLWEAGLALVALLGVNITVTVLFDWNGYRRGQKPEETQEEPETAPAEDTEKEFFEETLQIPDSELLDEVQLPKEETFPEEELPELELSAEDLPELETGEEELPAEIPENSETELN